MSDRSTGPLAVPPARPRWVTFFSPIPSSSWPLAFRWASTGSSPFAAGRAACLAPRRWRSSRSRAGVGSGPPGARSTGCATCAPPAARPITVAAGRKRSVRPSWTRRSESGSFATSSVPSREASRSVSGSFASSMGSISTVRWKRPRVDASSSSTQCASGQPRSRASQSSARIVFASRNSPRSAAATASRHGIFSRSRCSSSSGPRRSPSAGRRSVAR